MSKILNTTKYFEATLIVEQAIAASAANAMGSALSGAATDRMADQAPDENEIAETKEIAETEAVTHAKLPDAKLPIVADPHRVDYVNDAVADPHLDLSHAEYQMGEINRARMQSRATQPQVRLARKPSFSHLMWQDVKQDAVDAYHGIEQGAINAYRAARAAVNNPTQALINEGLSLYKTALVVGDLQGTMFATEEAICKQSRAIYDAYERADPETRREMFARGVVDVGEFAATFLIGGVASKVARLGLFAEAARGESLMASVSEAEGADSKITFELAPRVEQQLADSRMGSLAGKLDAASLNELAGNPEAQLLYDSGTGNINVINNVDGKLLRITTPRDSFKIISVGPIQERNIINSINSGRFIPIGNQLEESTDVVSYMNRIRP